MNRKRILVETLVGRRDQLIQTLLLRNGLAPDGAEMRNAVTIRKTLAIYGESAVEAAAVLYPVTEKRIMRTGAHLIELGSKSFRQFRTGSAFGTFTVQTLM